MNYWKTRTTFVVVVLLISMAIISNSWAQEIPPEVTIEVVPAENGSVQLASIVTESPAETGSAMPLFGAASSDPAALIAADLNNDHVADIISGYALASGGVLQIQYMDADTRQMMSTDDPLLPQVDFVELSVTPDFLAAGDFNGDNRVDIVVAERQSNRLLLLAQNDAGAFALHQERYLAGTITSLVAGEFNVADQQTDLATGILSGSQAALHVLSSPDGAFTADPQIFAMGGAVQSITFDLLDEDTAGDILVAAGNELAIIHGLNHESQMAGHAHAISKRAFSFSVLAAAAGDFTGRGSNTEIALVTDDGDLHLLLSDVKPEIVRMSNRSTFNQDVAQSVEIQTLQEAAVDYSPAAEDLPVPIVEPLPLNEWQLTPSFSPMEVVDFNTLTLQKVQTGSNAADDLLLVNDERASLLEVTTPPSEARGSEVTLSMMSTPLVDESGRVEAVVPARLNADAADDLIMLDSEDSAPQLMMTMITEAYFVDSIEDEADSNLGDGLCAATLGDGSSGCTLRAAIEESNASPNAAVINFAFADSGPITIQPTGPLPEIQDATFIDGWSQGGADYQGPPLIVLDGSQVGEEVSGLIITGNQSKIRGLVINNWQVSGIQIIGGNGNEIVGNYIGTDHTGTDEQTNGDSGIQIRGGASNNDIGLGRIDPGMPCVGNCNLISGNDRTGVVVYDGAASNRIQGNYIGPDITGRVKLNGFENDGVLVSYDVNSLNPALIRWYEVTSFRVTHITAWLFTCPEQPYKGT